MVITSLNNDKVKELVRLREKKYRDKCGLFFIEGYDLVKEAYDAGMLLELYLIEGTEVPFDIKYTYVSKDVMKKISDLESFSPYFGICKKKEEKEIGNKIIILDNIQDPGNLGAIIRSACAFGFNTIVLSNDTVDLYNPKTIRSSKGMLFHINIIVKNLVEFINGVEGYVIYGTDVNNGNDISKEEFSSKIGLVIGNEGQGVSEEVKKLCNKNLYINMDSNCESLNAAVAASILMYEVSKK